MIYSSIKFFYPDLKGEELKKFTLLSAMLFLIVGTYWLLRCLKDTIFMKIAFPESLGWLPHQGRLLQPMAKFWSPFVVLVLVLVYAKLVDLFKKHQLFYIICGFYSVLMAAIAGVLFVNQYYGVDYVGKVPLASAGWISYFLIESFGSFVPGALFWAFANSICDENSAKRGFPLIVMCAQIGAVIGSALLLFSESIGIVQLLILASVLVACVIPLVYYFIKVTPHAQLVGDKVAAATEKKKEGFFEGFFSGLILLLTRPYLLGILIVSTFYEIAQQVFDYLMKSQATLHYATPTQFGWFLGIFGIATNGIALIVALLGTRQLIKVMGLRISLLAYPVLFAGVVAILLGYFTFFSPSSTQLLWASFTAMIIIKGLSYAINNPTKEIMYIPTSKDAKFKSKSWVDMFGARFAKAGGGRITNALKENLTQLMVYGSLISFGLIGVWLVAALYVGFTNHKLVKEGKIIE